MIILAIDTSVKKAGIALSDDKKLIKTKLIESKQTHSETLMTEISLLLKECNIMVNDIDMFSCVTGPGSFTGIRVGVSLIKGLAFNSGKPCVGVSSLSALAENVSFFDGDYIVCPVIDARRTQLYNALFRLHDHKLERLCEDRIITADILSEQLSAYNNIVFTGDGIQVITSFHKGNFTVDDSVSDPDAFSVAKEAFDKYNNSTDISIFTDLNLKPVYLRPSQAEMDYKID